MKFTLFKNDDIDRYLDEKAKIELSACVAAITKLREIEGKKQNTYLIIDKNEPYADEVIEIMKRYGHWV